MKRSDWGCERCRDAACHVSTQELRSSSTRYGVEGIVDYLLLPPIALLHWGCERCRDAACRVSTQELRSSSTRYGVEEIVDYLLLPPIASLHWGLLIFNPSDFTKNFIFLILRNAKH